MEVLKKSLRIGGKMVMGAAVKLGEQAVLSQVALGFRNGVDPYGKKWKPLTYRNGQPLLKTHIMSKSFTGESSGDTIRIGNNVERTIFHQGGTKTKEGKEIVPARKMIPDNNEIPAAWARAVESAIRKAFDAVTKAWPK